MEWPPSSAEFDSQKLQLFVSSQLRLLALQLSMSLVPFAHHSCVRKVSLPLVIVQTSATRPPKRGGEREKQVVSVYEYG